MTITSRQYYVDLAQPILGYVVLKALKSAINADGFDYNPQSAQCEYGIRASVTTKYGVVIMITGAGGDWIDPRVDCHRLEFHSVSQTILTEAQATDATQAAMILYYDMLFRLDETLAAGIPDLKYPVCRRGHQDIVRLIWEERTHRFRCPQHGLIPVNNDGQHDIGMYVVNPMLD